MSGSGDGPEGAGRSGVAPTSAELVEALGRPDAYSHPVERVELGETHISWLFFAGDRVYKVKKPVDLGFLDASTLARRRTLCEDEVRLNRRLAPGVHLGVQPVTRAADGRLVLGGMGEALEYAVEMVRLPAHRMMDVLLDRGEIDEQLICVLADVLVDFHAGAARGEEVRAVGAPGHVAGLLRDNLEGLRPWLEEVAHRGFAAFFTESLDRLADLLRVRVDEDRVVEGHGDLHAGNVCFHDGHITIYDCIEFSFDFRCGDVALDLAFLVMDLDRRGFRGFGASLVRHYAEGAGDPDLAKLMPLYKCHRALVRAKVAHLRASGPGVSDAIRDRALAEAGSYERLAASYTLPPALVLTCGLPGTGKSWVARALAEPFEALVLRSDVIRKRLAGIPPLEHPTGEVRDRLYGAEATARTYGELAALAAEGLEGGRTVVADATFSRVSDRAAFRELADRLGAPFVLVHVTCDEATAEARLAARTASRLDASDADVAVRRAARQRFEAPVELPPENRLEHDSAVEGSEAALADALVSRLEALVRPRKASGGGTSPDRSTGDDSVTRS